MNTKTKEAGKTASFLKMLTSGTSPRVEVVKDTGAGKIPQQLKEIKVKKEQTKTDVPKINTDKTFKKNIVILNPENAFKGNNIADMTRSTAKNEKQRLYETNDTFLNNQELLKKYQYVADDKDMDYNTMRRAANNGIRTVGRVLKENSDRNTYQNVAELQVKLQSRLKSASFTAGMLDSISGDAMRIAAKASGNQVIQNQARVMQNQLEQMKNSNPTAGMMGTVTGELAKGAAGYMTFGKAAEDAVLRNAEKLKLTGLKERAIAGLLAQQAADTAVNTPITIAAGMADGKNRKEIGKDIGKQMAVDAAVNTGFVGIGTVGKMLKNASRKGSIAGIDFEKIGYAHATVNDELMQFRNDILRGNPNKTAIYNLIEPHERMRADIQRLTGVDVSDFKNRIKANAIDHIEKRHGVNGQHDHSMANPEDLAKLEYILNDYDDVILSNGKKTGAYRNRDGSPAEKVMFSKRINGTYYVIEAVPDSKAKSLDIVSVYKSNPNNKKTKKVAKSFDASSPQVTSKNVSQQPFDSSIEQNTANVKAALQQLALQAHKLRKK